MRWDEQELSVQTFIANIFIGLHLGILNTNPQARELILPLPHNQPPAHSHIFTLTLTLHY